MSEKYSTLSEYIPCDSIGHILTNNQIKYHECPENYIDDCEDHQYFSKNTLINPTDAGRLHLHDAGIRVHGDGFEKI